MEYSTKQLMELSGVTKRTLYYYEELGLIKPSRNQENNYRIYSSKDLDNLQHVLFLRQLNLPIEKIIEIFQNPNFDRLKMYQEHLSDLEKQQEQLKLLINNLQKTIKSYKGEIKMTGKEKFEGFKQQMIEENVEKYGEEITLKYGEDALNKSNKKVSKMTEEQWHQVENISKRFEETIVNAFKNDLPLDSSQTKKAVELHKQWLDYFGDFYTPEIHQNLAQMYVDDQRFKANYEKLSEGLTEYLHDAIVSYYKD